MKSAGDLSLKIINEALKQCAEGIHCYPLTVKFIKRKENL